MNHQDLKQALLHLPENASEAIVNSVFISKLLLALGFGQADQVPNFRTGLGSQLVDYAARKSTEDDQFIHTKTNPYLLIEAKARSINLCKNSPQYEATVQQLKKYLLSPNCKSVCWGIISNSQQIQLFRKHNKVIYPATDCLELNTDNAVDTVAKVRQQIEAPEKALTVAIYNNKGGVGKTTTTVNLAAVLTLSGKKVLVIDFDPNQQDLTHSLGIEVGQQGFYACMKNKRANIDYQVIQHHTVSLKNKRFVIDVIPSDQTFADKSENELRQELRVYKLQQMLKPLKSQYDYILIDTPPNWRFVSTSAIYAADVVLIPTKHNNIFSLINAATAIQKYIPEVQEYRKDGGPIALPVFFNGENITDFQQTAAHKAIDKIILQAKREFNLLPYFYPRYTNAQKDRYIFDLPSYARIANAAFEQIPAVYKNKTARDYYLALAKEYFLQ
ncbi:MAG: AAA family ATPase [Limnoraphis robusta]